MYQILVLEPDPSKQSGDQAMMHVQKKGIGPFSIYRKP
jgi:hypothetical protein